MAGVFICYRREDSSPYAGRVYDCLVEVFGAAQVFMDVNGIRPGEDFVDAIELKVRSCDAMVVVIGKEWLTPGRETGVARLANPDDYVRLEIAAALRRKIPIIPALVSGAQMPRGLDLPSDLAPLSRRQSVSLNDAYFRQSLVPLISALENALAESPKTNNIPAVQDPRIVDRPINLDFDGPIEDGFPHGWFNSLGFVSGVSLNYEAHVVQRIEGRGQCLRLEGPNVKPEEFGSVMQRFPAGFLAGRTVRFEGDVRTESVEGWAGLWMRADGLEEPDLFFDNMSGQQLSGNTSWKRYAIEGYLPPSTAWLNIGVVLSGVGRVWVDSLRLTKWEAGKWVDV